MATETGTAILLNGLTHRTHLPQTSTPNGLPLTEYAADPSPTLQKSPASLQVPEAFLLPDGFPDVRDRS